MNIFNIAMKEIKLNLNDIRTLIFMLAFPIVLMLILGSALSNAFDSKIKVDNIHVLYKAAADTKVTSYFQSFIKNAEKSSVHFKMVSGTVDGRQEVKENRYTAYVELTDQGMQLYSSNRNSIEGSIVQGMLSAFADRYNMTAAVASVDPSKLSTVMASNSKHDFIKERSLKSAKKPGSMDYYAMAMTTMIALYGALYASSLIREERTRNTALRLVVAPIRKSEIFLGKILGCLTVNTVCILAVVAFSHFVYKADWGDHIGLVLLVLLSEVFFAVSFGLGVSYIAKTGEATRMIIMIVIQLSSFFGGAYFKIDNPTGILNYVTKLSPLTWANQAITKIIYTNDMGAALTPITLNLGISIIFLGIAIISFQKREGL
jgi:ABC-2 type transport system permease protein